MHSRECVSQRTTRYAETVVCAIFLFPDLCFSFFLSIFKRPTDTRPNDAPARGLCGEMKNSFENEEGSSLFTKPEERPKYQSEDQTELVDLRN